MDNFEYVDMEKIKLKIGEDNEKSDEKVLDIPDQIMDQIRLAMSVLILGIGHIGIHLNHRKESA